jgi:hypothetical protein
MAVPTTPSSLAAVTKSASSIALTWSASAIPTIPTVAGTLVFHLRAEDLPSSGKVSSWTDMGSYAKNAVQAVEAKQPTVVPNAIGSYSAISFGEGVVLETPSINSITSTIFVVAISGSDIAGEYALALGGASYGIIQGFNDNQWEWYSAGREQIGTTSTTVWQCISTKNRVTATEAWTIGGQSNDYENFSGKIAEIAVYDSALSDADIATIRGYFNTKFGTAIATEKQSISGATYNSGAINFDADYASGASKFQASSSYTLTRVDVPLWKNGTPAFSCVAAIYSDSANAPGSLIGTASSEVDMSSIPTSEGAEVSFTGLSATISSGTLYWLVIYKSSGTSAYGTTWVWWPFINNAEGTPMENVRSTYAPTTWLRQINAVDGYKMPAKLRIFGA